MSVFAQLRVAIRSLGKSPGFTITAIATLGISIGACSAIFSVVNAVLLAPLPYRNPAQLALLWADIRGRNVSNVGIASADFKDLRAQQLFADVATVTSGQQSVADDAANPEMARAAFVTPNVLSVLGISVAFGRNFVESDGAPQAPPPAATAPGPGAGQVQQQPSAPRLPLMVILSHGFWQRRYGNDSAIVGRSIQLGAGPAQVVGILPPDVELLFPPRANVERTPDLWIATRATPDGGPTARSNYVLRAVARLKDGQSLPAAQARMDRFVADLKERFPQKRTEDLHMRVEPMHLDIVRAVQRPLILLFGAVGFVLLIACTNVANLTLVRVSVRERELAIRSALGGNRRTLIEQLLTESFVLAGIGTTVGLLLAWLGLDFLKAIAPPQLPRLEGVRIDPTVLAFSVFATIVSVVVFGLVPAVRASRPDISELLRSGRAASQLGAAGLRNAAVVVAVALSFILLVGSGLMLRSFRTMANVDLGFSPDGLLTFQLQSLRQRTPRANAELAQQIADGLRRIPGVTAAASAFAHPLDGGTLSTRWAVAENAADDRAYRSVRPFPVHPGYFEATRARLIAGRTFTAADVPVPPDLPVNPTPQQIAAWQAAERVNVRPIVIDDKIAKVAFPNESAIGKRIAQPDGQDQIRQFEVVGVVAHQRHSALVGDEREMIFYAGTPLQATWLVRSTNGVSLAEVRRTITELDPMLVISNVRPMRYYVDRALTPTRFVFAMLATFAAIALILAAVGLYGVLASAVRQRTAEIGVRIALGAPPRSIYALVIGHGVRLSAIGLVAGAMGAAALSGTLRTLLVGVSATDPLTFAGTSALFLVMTMVACWIPARRAVALDPNVALREE